MRVTIKPSPITVPPRPIVESVKKRTRESYAAIIRPDFEQIEFVNMPQTISLKEISLRLSKHAAAKYVPHVAEADDYQFYAYVDEFASEKRAKVNELGLEVAQLLGFNVGEIRGPLIIVGPPASSVETTCGQPFDERTKLLLEKKMAAAIKKKAS